jgi:hypothetical protein
VSCLQWSALRQPPRHASDALIYLEMGRQVLCKGYRWVDMSLTGEDNPVTNNLATRVGVSVDKRYRVYEWDLGD